MNKVGKTLCVLVCVAVIIMATIHILNREDKTITQQPVVKEYELISIHPYTEINEHGLFCKKKDTTEYVEYVYESEEGIQIAREFRTAINIGEKDKVLIEGEGVFKLINVYITLDTYNEMYETSN